MTSNKSVINWAYSSQEGTYLPLWPHCPMPIRQVISEVAPPPELALRSALVMWKKGYVWQTWSDVSLLIFRLQHDGMTTTPPAWTSMSTTSTFKQPAPFIPIPFHWHAPPPQLIWKVAILLWWSVYHIGLAYKLKPVGPSIAHHMRYALYFSSFSISLLIPYRRFCLLSSPFLNQCWWHCRPLYPPLDGTDQPHPSLFHFSNILISLLAAISLLFYGSQHHHYIQFQFKTINMCSLSFLASTTRCLLVDLVSK